MEKVFHVKKISDVCKDCAEYGSHFCEECLSELNKDLNSEDKVILNKMIQNIAGRMVDNTSKD